MVSHRFKGGIILARPKKPINFEVEIATIEAKIQRHQKSITELKVKRKALLECKNTAAYDSLIDAIKDSGKSPEEVLSMLHQ